MTYVKRVYPSVEEWVRDENTDWIAFLGRIAGISHRVNPDKETLDKQTRRLQHCLAHRHMGVFEHWQIDELGNLRDVIAKAEEDTNNLTNWAQLLALFEEYRDRSCELPEQKYRTFFFICSRGCSHELVRYRTNISYLQESTRYVNYVKTGYEYILTKRAGLQQREAAVLNAFKAYKQQYAAQIPTEVSREVLPIATATRIAVTAPVWKWQYIIEQRADHLTGRAAPEISALIEQVKELL